MARREIRFAIVGCGKIAQRHADIVHDTPGLELTAVCDPDASAREAMAGRLAVPAGRRFASFRDLLDSRCCDAITICTPSGLHGAMIEAAAAAGVHCLVEKPLDVTLARVDAAIRACRAADVRLGVIYQRRGLQLFRRMVETVASGGLGPLAMADTAVKWFRPTKYYDPASWHGSRALEGGGALANQGVHGIDAVQWVAGGVESVKAFIATRAHPVEVEDTAVVAVRYHNGAVGCIQAATCSFPGEPLTFSFHGPKGTILVSNEKIARWVADGEDRTDAMKAEQASWPESGDAHAGHRALILDFAEAVREGRPPIVDGLVGRESVAVLEAIYESHRAGTEIPVQPPPADLR